MGLGVHGPHVREARQVDQRPPRAVVEAVVEPCAAGLPPVVDPDVRVAGIQQAGPPVVARDERGDLGQDLALGDVLLHEVPAPPARSRARVGLSEPLTVDRQWGVGWGRLAPAHGRGHPEAVRVGSRGAAEHGQQQQQQRADHDGLRATAEAAGAGHQRQPRRSAPRPIIPHGSDPESPCMPLAFNARVYLHKD